MIKKKTIAVNVLNLKWSYDNDDLQNKNNWKKKNNYGGEFQDNPMLKEKNKKIEK
jgi:hypothetical protein